MAKRWDGYILSGAIHQAASLVPLILMRASGNTSCIMVRFRAQDILQTQALNLAACLAVLLEIHQETHRPQELIPTH